MDQFSNVAYAHYILSAFDRAEDEFDTGLSLEEREALAESIEQEITRSMTFDTITDAGFQRACTLKEQYLSRWALTRDDQGQTTWLDTHAATAATVLPFRTVLIPSTPRP